MIKRIKIYKTEDGKRPFQQWFESLKDYTAINKIEARIERIKFGNPGIHKSVGSGVFELKIDFGPGYRIYFGQEGSQIIILLCGGDKKTQNKDIKLAKLYWEDVKKRL